MVASAAASSSGDPPRPPWVAGRFYTPPGSLTTQIPAEGFLFSRRSGSRRARRWIASARRSRSSGPPGRWCGSGSTTMTGPAFRARSWSTRALSPGLSPPRRRSRSVRRSRTRGGGGWRRACRAPRGRARRCGWLLTSGMPGQSRLDARLEHSDELRADGRRWRVAEPGRAVDVSERARAAGLPSRGVSWLPRRRSTGTTSRPGRSCRSSLVRGCCRTGSRRGPSSRPGRSPTTEACTSTGSRLIGATSRTR